MGREVSMPAMERHSSQAHGTDGLCTLTRSGPHPQDLRRPLQAQRASHMP